MLRTLRKNTKLILWVLLLLIVPPFVFFGIESAFVRKGDPIVGVLFGQRIHFTDFLKSKNHASAMVRLRQPQGIDDTFLTQMTWQRLVFLHQAIEAKIRVSDTELSDAIQKAFSFKGEFNPKAYELFVKGSLRLSIAEFENAFRETLMIEKFQSTLSKLVQVSDDEVYESFFYDHEKVEMNYCEIPFERFLKSMVISEDEVKNYFSEHKEAFRVGTQRKADYISIALKGLKEKIKVSPKEIEDHYTQHKDIYHEPLTKVSGKIEDELKTQKAREKAQKLADAVYRRLSKKQAPAPSEVVQSLGLTLESTDFFTQENLPKIWNGRIDITVNIFKTKLQNPARPIFIQDAFYVIIPTQEKPSYTPELSEVESKVRDILVESKAKEEARKQTQVVLAAVRSSMRAEKISFSDACVKAGEKVFPIPPFTRSEAQGPADPLGNVKNKAWDLKAGEISEVLATQKGSAFLFLEKTFPPPKEDFEKTKASLRERAADQKRQKIFYEYYDSLMRQCQIFDVKKAQEMQ